MSKFNHEVSEFHPIIESLIQKSGWTTIGASVTHKYSSKYYEDMIFWNKFLDYLNRELISINEEPILIDSDLFATLRIKIITDISVMGIAKFLKQPMEIVLPSGTIFRPYPVDKDWKRNEYHYKRELSLTKERDGSIDFAWIVNGFILFSNEVKLNNPGRKEAEAQYKTRPQNHPYFKFNHRSIAHFCNDELTVSFSTFVSPNSKFLPFNKDIENPKSLPFETAYLYSEFMTPEHAVKLIHEFIFVHSKDNKNILVFPRYHQFRDVLDLSKKHWNGSDFDNSPVLSQHAPGAGKTYKEIWDAYQAIKNNKYQKAILGANSKKLVKQLFDEGSAFFDSFPEQDKIKLVLAEKPLKDVLKENPLRTIICTTLQKFNQTSQEALSSFKDQRFFISIDEETGTGGKNQGIATELGQIEEEIGSEDTNKFYEVYKKMRASENLKFSCNTGTPSADTLDLFGCLDSNGEKKAHYYYSMEQSMKEGFTVYPLQNYISVAPEYVAKALNPDKKVHQLVVDSEVRRQIAQQLHKEEMKEDRVAEVLKHIKKIKKKGHLQAALHAVSSVKEAIAVTKILREIAPPWLKICVDFNVTNDTREELQFLNKELLEKHKDKVKIDTIGDFFKERSEYNYMIVVNKNLIGYSNDRVNVIVLDRTLSTDEVIVQVISRANRNDSTWDKITYVIDTCGQQAQIERAMAKYYSKQSVIQTSIKRMNGILDVFKTQFKTIVEFNAYLSEGISLDEKVLKLMVSNLVNEETQNSAIGLLVEYQKLYQEIIKKDESVNSEQINFFNITETLIKKLEPHRKESGIGSEDISEDLEIKVLGYTSEEVKLELPELKEKPVKLDNPQDPEYKELKKALEKHHVLEEFSESDRFKMLPLYKKLQVKGLSSEQMESTIGLLIKCSKGESRKLIVANKDPDKMAEQIKNQVFVHTIKNKELKVKIYDDKSMLHDIVETVGKLAVVSRQ